MEMTNNLYINYCSISFIKIINCSCKFLIISNFYVIDLQKQLDSSNNKLEKTQNTLTKTEAELAELKKVNHKSLHYNC